ncbi:MAG: hypothetical protein QOH48_1106 [Actinomycetota bacterium]|jgi:hypothetical protein|nr:hypothetical protein [Actinomycetota bacterium]
MSPPRRRRRRRGRGDQPESASAKQPEGQQQAQPGREPAGRSRSRGRRRSRSGAPRQSSSPFLSEDLVRALPKERPATLTGPPDGQTLEKLIGDLQSEWGVPQYPQEYRITIKVADERDVRSERPASNDRPATLEPHAHSGGEPGMPKREKAPAAPRVGATGTAEREAAPKRRRGRRRRRKGRGTGESGPAANPPAATQEADAGGDHPPES